MTIRRTKKYLAAVSVARELGLAVAKRHTSAEEVYTELESLYHWDAQSERWVENPKTDPLREMDKQLVRVRVTAHMDKLVSYTSRVVTALEKAGFIVQETSKPYPNSRDTDGAGRVYVAFRSK